ncbi:serine/threonine-protein kinase-like protein CCR4-like [Tripterygium wilfordii]|uniref:Serine/threonine-protein kinase-like protein CCR4-like n=1 Tax=Tripterygium wilfordii TaxID=458696 RepID=A0A7J7CF75_TRIWF|nr:serine/threonine-protein kinase-like protein CCR4-like [Tripterygium wilfordii]
MCALKSFSSLSTSAIFCWRFSASGTIVEHKRIYYNTTINELEEGDRHICGLVGDSNQLGCWQWRRFNSTISQNVSKIAVGGDFMCGLSTTGRPFCAPNGTNSGITDVPEGNYSVIAAGSRHACAINSSSSLNCWGDSVGEIPQGEFMSLALGDNRSCALRTDRKVVCWGQNNFSLPENLTGSFFVSIEAKRRVFCGVLTEDFSLKCWGNENFETNYAVFEEVLPGPCRKDSNECPCGPLAYSGRICGQGCICQPCKTETQSCPPPQPPCSPPPPQQSSSSSHHGSPRMVAFLVMGCVGSLALLIVLGYFFFKYCAVKGCRVHDSGPLEETRPSIELNPNQNQTAAAVPVLEKRLSQLTSMGNAGNLEEFPLEVLLQSTNNFAENHKIGTGSFGAVYYATLPDGREVAIKRAEISNISTFTGVSRREQDKDNAFINELEHLSRLNHKYLVRLLGFCEDCHERVLIYEYMANGTLHDHLHKLESSPLISWAARIKLLSGFKAIHKNESGVPRNVVDYVVPYIVHDEIHRVLDPKVPPPTPFEIEAVRYVGYLAADCVTPEGRDRPSMTEVVDSLERAFNACLVHPSSMSRSTTGSST